MELVVLEGERVRLRPLAAGDLDPLAAIIASPGVREWWGESGSPERVREDLRNDGHAFAIDERELLVGWLGFFEENDPDYRHASLDISLAPPAQGRGLGPEALRAAIRWLAGERGHHRFTIDPAAHNARAIRAYESLGFRPVGILRRYERGLDGNWHDGLLMDLVIEELRP